MKLLLTRAALEDLQSIRAYTLQTWGTEQEKRYLDRIWARFGEILAHPERHRIRSGLFPACRIAAEGKHIILYRASPGQLEIVRVLHSAMDFRRQSPGDESR